MQGYQTNLQIFGISFTSLARVQSYEGTITAGFPSPAADYVQRELDLNEFLVQHKASTFMALVEGSSMVDANIHDGDIVIIDRAIEPISKSLVAAVLDGGFLIKRYLKQGGSIILKSENSAYPSITVSEDMDFEIWGVVTYIIHRAQ